MIFLIVISCGLLACETAAASDWPMYRGDAGRRGVTQDSLPKNLSLAWSRELLKLTPAFNDARLQFDAGYEPVVANGVLLTASSRTDSIKAYDTKTGKELWAFYTDGPVRLAPAIGGEFACFGSDDGCLYCVAVTTGKLHWKHQAVPSQRRLLGNKRLISVWPVRGGPVVADGIVYFAAGVWPFEGVFVYAMEIETGNVVWRNDRLGYMFGQQPHNTKAIGGLAPQGYLLINDDELIVPCSNAYPARLNRHTGELISFELPKSGRYPGGWFAALDPDKARAVRRGLLTFDDVVNRHQHEGGVNSSSGGVAGLSRRIRTADTTLDFNQKCAGVDGMIHSMVVADNALFVTTRDGRIMCFRQTSGKASQSPVIRKRKTTRLTTSDDAMKTAMAIVQSAAGRHGIAIVVGLSDGALTKALIESSEYHVVVFDDNHDRIQQLRNELDQAGFSGRRAAVIHSDLRTLKLPPYITTTLVSEQADVAFLPLLQTLRPFGGMAVGGHVSRKTLTEIELGNFSLAADRIAGLTVVRRVGRLPGATQYAGDFSASHDKLVRFPLGVLWFDDTLAHFKRSPQPVFDCDTMISRPKNWQVPRFKESNKIDYPLFPPVLSDIYTGRVLDASERRDLRATLNATSSSILEPSQYRPEGQPFASKSVPRVAGQRVNPLTGETEARAFPKTYGCDGGVDYGDFYTLRSGTAAYYDKTIESGTVFLSGPRSGCTNSIIPSGGLLNVPYYYDGCTCSYPLPTAMSLVAMPQSHEQWSSWGESKFKPGSIQRIGINFGAPGDRMTRDGTLWLDYPSVGGPSPDVNIEATKSATYHYQHSVWMQHQESYPWVSASMAQGLQRFVIKDLKPGSYQVRLYFAEPEAPGRAGPKHRLQDIKLQGQNVVHNFDIADEAGGVMRGIIKTITGVEVKDDLTLELSAPNGPTVISGLELIRQPD